MSHLTEEDKMNEVFAKHLGSSFSTEVEEKINRLYGKDVAAKAKTIYNDALACPVDWRTATIDSALPVLADYLKAKYPWLTPEAKSALNYCFIMAWK